MQGSSTVQYANELCTFQNETTAKRHSKANFNLAKFISFLTCRGYKYLTYHNNIFTVNTRNVKRVAVGKTNEEFLVHKVFLKKKIN